MGIKDYEPYCDPWNFEESLRYLPLESRFDENHADDNLPGDYSYEGFLSRFYKVCGQNLENITTRDKIAVIHLLSGRLLRRFAIDQPPVEIERNFKPDEPVSETQYARWKAELRHYMLQRSIFFLRDNNGVIWPVGIDSLVDLIYDCCNRQQVQQIMQSFLTLLIEESAASDNPSQH